MESYFAVGSSGYWKNDTPLKHFAKYVKDGSGNDVYTFNNIQFNVDYDAPIANTTGTKYLDSALSNVKSYITFEPISSSYKADSYFTNGIAKLSIDRVVRPDANWATTKYEVVDGTIIYPPVKYKDNTFKALYKVRDTGEKQYQTVDSNIFDRGFKRDDDYKVFSNYATKQTSAGYDIKDIWTYEFQIYNPKPVSPDTANSSYEATTTAPKDDLAF